MGLIEVMDPVGKSDIGPSRYVHQIHLAVQQHLRSITVLRIGITGIAVIG